MPACPAWPVGGLADNPKSNTDAGAGPVCARAFGVMSGDPGNAPQGDGALDLSSGAVPASKASSLLFARNHDVNFEGGAKKVPYSWGIVGSSLLCSVLVN